MSGFEQLDTARVHRSCRGVSLCNHFIPFQIQLQNSPAPFMATYTIADLLMPKDVLIRWSLKAVFAVIIPMVAITCVAPGRIRFSESNFTVNVVEREC